MSIERAPKKLAMLPAIRCTDEYATSVARCAAAEDRSASAFMRRAITHYMLQFHPGMVDLAEDRVTDFGALHGDARGPGGD